MLKNLLVFVLMGCCLELSDRWRGVALMLGDLQNSTVQTSRIGWSDAVVATQERTLPVFAGRMDLGWKCGRGRPGEKQKFVKALFQGPVRRSGLD